MKRTNPHLHPPDEKAISCCEVKTNIKRKEKQSQDSSHYIEGECVQTVNEGIATKLPKLDSLKRMIQRQRVQTAPVQPTTLEQLIIPKEFMRTSDNYKSLENAQILFAYLNCMFANFLSIPIISCRDTATFQFVPQVAHCTNTFATLLISAIYDLK